MDGLYLGADLYRAYVGTIVPVAGTGDVERIKSILGPLARDRLDPLATHLAQLDPCPVTGKMTDNQVIIALGEHGDIWPRSIWGQVVIAYAEDAAKQRAALQ
jgi:hypothetical protein